MGTLFNGNNTKDNKAHNRMQVANNGNETQIVSIHPLKCE